MEQHVISRLRMNSKTILSLQVVRGSAILLATALVAGCGSGAGNFKVAVKGKVVQNGTPLKVENHEIGVGRIEVHFIPAEGDANAPHRTALAQTDGTFELDGDLNPGKYKVAIYALEQPKTPGATFDPESGFGGMVDKLDGAFSAQNTPIVLDITSAADLGEIDLAKYAAKP